MSTNVTIPERPDQDEFQAALEELLRAATRGGVEFDRAWDVETEARPERLMIEITRVAPRQRASTSATVTERGSNDGGRSRDDDSRRELRDGRRRERTAMRELPIL